MIPFPTLLHNVRPVRLKARGSFIQLAQKSPPMDILSYPLYYHHRT
jgi:hypothetical protein